MGQALFKYCDNFLDAIDKQKPSLVGFSNYTWNEALTAFVGRYVKRIYSDIPIIMGGPNIRSDDEGIQSFLENNDFVDVYITFEGEVPFVSVLQEMFRKYPKGICTGKELREFNLESCFSLRSGMLQGKHRKEDRAQLDYIPSPYTTGLLDEFLKSEFIILFESSRGCPYACSYCTWGASARRHVKQFSLERVRSDMEYVARQGKIFNNWTFVDANFGILSRDIKIAQTIKDIYNQYRPFLGLTIWWDKNAKNHVVEIAKILKGLANAYIAFQTFDPYVERMINRRNISSERLQKMLGPLSVSSERLHTDILLGLPGETMDSHLASLSKAYKLGFDSIGGGEIRLLKGSNLEEDKSRKKFEICTKYRLIQEGFGIYRGNFIVEFEESVRSTKWITEEEMINLRVLRAIFFGAIYIGELGPLVKYLKIIGIDVLSVFQYLLEKKNQDAHMAVSIDWLSERAHNEWHNTKEDAIEFYSKKENREKLLKNPVTKLNFDFLSYIMLSQDRYNSFYECFCKIIKRYFSLANITIVDELSILCKKRNYIVKCLRDNFKPCVSVTLSHETIQYLQTIGYIKTSKNKLSLAMDESVSKVISNLLKEAEPKIQTISLLTQKFSIYLLPTYADQVVKLFNGR